MSLLPFPSSSRCESNILGSVIIKRDSTFCHIVCQLFFFHHFVTQHEQWVFYYDGHFWSIYDEVFLRRAPLPALKQQGRSGEEKRCCPINQRITAWRFSPCFPALLDFQFSRACAVSIVAWRKKIIVRSLISAHGSSRRTTWAWIKRRSGFHNGASALEPAG